MQVNRMAVLESSLMLRVVSALGAGRQEMINYLRLLRHMALSAGEGKTEGKSRPDELCERRCSGSP